MWRAFFEQLLQVGPCGCRVCSHIRPIQPAARGQLGKLNAAFKPCTSIHASITCPFSGRAACDCIPCYVVCGAARFRFWGLHLALHSCFWACCALDLPPQASLQVLGMTGHIIALETCKRACLELPAPAVLAPLAQHVESSIHRRARCSLHTSAHTGASSIGSQLSFTPAVSEAHRAHCARCALRRGRPVLELRQSS